MGSYDDDDYESSDNDSESTTSNNDENEHEIDNDNEVQIGGVQDFQIEDEDDDVNVIEDDDEIDNEELDLDENTENGINKQIKALPENINLEYDNEAEETEDENYLQKFDKEINKNYIMNFHPECIMHNYDEVEALTKVVRDKNNIIIDNLHKTIPYLTKYERTRILGQRAKQINAGGTAFVKVPENVIDGYLIAELELREKRIPFIIRRPLPNGGSEYWNVKDLENIAF
jgi:DNA-directed RNA polymerase I, II, and III subunit RPABC2